MVASSASDMAADVESPLLSEPASSEQAHSSSSSSSGSSSSSSSKRAGCPITGRQSQQPYPQQQCTDGT
eukprot:COSAG06_NODE_14343_length_1165_cov_0.876173_1_plen_69_part_00